MHNLMHRSAFKGVCVVCDVAPPRDGRSMLIPL
jgi:hypothetical protein